MIANDFEALIALLGQEQAIYEEMAELLVAEGEALTSMAASRVAELVARKETLALRIKALDESRRLLARRLGAALGLTNSDLTVTKLACHAGSMMSRRLIAAGESLRAVLERCKKLNDANSNAARRGLDLIGDTAKWMLDQADPVGPVYRPGRRGVSYGAVGRGPAFISREA